jgi:epoxyqueuosine reductase
MNPSSLEELAKQIKIWGREMGFQQLGITDTDLSQQEVQLQAWLDKGYHGDMGWMAEHGTMRSRPDELVSGTIRVISARMDYLPGDTQQIQVLKNPEQAYVSRYSLGRDYHKLIRKRLSKLAKMIEDAAQQIPGLEQDVAQRAFVDSAPVMERALAAKAGLGWVGKHTLVLNAKAGSWFFLGEIYTNLPLPVDNNLQENQCGECTACLKVCPTDAFTGPYELDARRCISYLTIEYDGVIPEEFREPMGNRVFGCDDCQAICPWNKYASPSEERDFSPRHDLDKAPLLDLFNWQEDEFLKKTEGSPIRRIGYQRWLRNLSIGLGNAPYSEAIVEALKARQDLADEVLAEHLDWALQQQEMQKDNPRWRRKRKIKQ